MTTDAQIIRSKDNIKDYTVHAFSRCIKISANVLESISKYKQERFFDKEAGGVLIARENIENSNMIIECFTEPMAKDHRSRTRYTRLDEGHKHYYESLYKKHNGIYRYAGEWHTHPEHFPNFSSLDASNWTKIAHENPNQDMEYYHLIMGIHDFSIWQCRLINSGALSIDKIK